MNSEQTEAGGHRVALVGLGLIYGFLVLFAGVFASRPAWSAADVVAAAAPTHLRLPLSADTVAWSHLARVHGLAALLAILMTYLCCHPIFAFCYRGWEIKRQDVLSSLGDKSKALYMTTFLSQSQAPGRKPQARNLTFGGMYAWRYGRYRLIVPTILLIATAGCLSLGLAETAVGHLLEPHGSSQSPLLEDPTFSELRFMPETAAAAIAGAYAWIVYGLIRDAARYNLPPASVLGATLRLVVATPLGYALSATSAPALGPFIAFAIGGFPLTDVATFFRRLTLKKLGLDESADPQAGQVKLLDGIDAETALRLDAADITTVCQLAYCDPVQVSMRTNIAFDVVLDYVGQALTYIYFGARLNALRLVGLRGALEIRHVWLALNCDPGTPERTHADLTLASAIVAANAGVGAKDYGYDEPALRNALHEIAENPRTEFLDAVWGDSKTP